VSLELDPAEEVAYRLALAREHLDRARRRFQVEDWAGVVEAAQLAAENAAKAVIAHFHVPSWSHDPSRAHPHPRPLLGALPCGSFLARLAAGSSVTGWPARWAPSGDGPRWRNPAPSGTGR
jgi:hypothetical protein